MTAATNLDEIKSYVDSIRAEYEANLKKLVDVPSISMDPTCKEHIREAAEMAMELLKEAGCEAQLIETRGYPVVIGQLKSDPKHPTVTIYNHIDVQPAEASEWESKPFRMVTEGDVYKGRGTTDDKGPALAVLYAAKYARKANIPINIKFIWELEEEIGSPSFEQFLLDNKSKLETDSVVVSDTIWVSRDRPAIPYGLRGLQGVLLRLKTGAKDVHSGTTGGLARNPIGELCDLIAQCYDAKTGQVHIPGFYDDVQQPNEDELNNFVKSGFTTANFKKAHELTSLRTDDDREGSARVWAKPTFEVHGIVGGYSGPGVKTIVPHQAEAKISMRLVPNQDPDKIVAMLEKFIAERSKDVELIKEGTLRPFLGQFTGPYAQAAKESMKETFGVEPAFTREGGSIGAVVSMQKVLGKPIVFLGLSLPEHGYHAINENFDWQQAGGGIRMFVEYFRRLAAIKD